MKNYGQELILDLKECDVKRFTKKNIRSFMKELCKLIEMKRGPLHFWIYHWWEWKAKRTDPPHIVGTSAVQFISTSSITIHTLKKLKTVYINIFSCKDFDSIVAIRCTIRYFGGDIMNRKTLPRG